MAHGNNARSLTHTSYPLCAIQSNDLATTVLKDFAKYSVTLRNILYDDSPLKDTEYAFMENHMQVLEMAYQRWKRKHMWPTDFC